jgi:hypothetical protein
MLLPRMLLPCRAWCAPGAAPGALHVAPAHVAPVPRMVCARCCAGRAPLRKVWIRQERDLALWLCAALVGGAGKRRHRMAMGGQGMTRGMARAKASLSVSSKDSRRGCGRRGRYSHRGDAEHGQRSGRAGQGKAHFAFLQEEAPQSLFFNHTS